MDQKFAVPTTDPAAVAANRQGKLTDEQREMIAASANPRIWVIGGVIILALMLGSIFCLGSMDPAVIGVLLLVFGLALLFVLWRGFRMWSLRKKLFSAPVQSAQGQVTFKPMTLTDPGKYVARTDEGKQLNAGGLAGMGVNLLPGRYNFFYLPAKSWLVSAEALSSEAELQANLREVLLNALQVNPADLERLGREAREGRIQAIEGPVKVHIITGSQDGISQSYIFQVGDLKFEVPGAAQGAVLNGQVFRVYYDGRNIKGIEPLP